MPRADLDRVLHELAQTATYLQQSGVLMREAVQHLIETEHRLEQTNLFLQRTVEHVTHAIDAALRAHDAE
jgi:hypothetical protein